MTSTATPATATKPARMLSMDVLRGLTLGFMILVNNNGDWEKAYWALKHAAWNGFTPTDLVFPTFLFLVGVSTVFSTESRLARGAGKQSLFLHVLWRTVVIFLLGLIVNSFPFFHLATLRFYGVLPRIAVCYFIVGTLYLLNSGWKSKAALAVVALIGYWLLMRFVPVPGFGIPTHDMPILDPDGNLTAWLDRQIFSPAHLYEKTRDPEGLLSTLPAVGTALFGVLTGIWLRTSRTLVEKARGIALAGLTSLLLGGIWNIWFPINKKLWTSSFVLFAGGLSLLMLALCIWIVDIRGAEESRLNPEKHRGRYTFFLVFGMNAIASYVFSELMPGILSNIHVRPGINVTDWVYRSILHVVPDVAFASLLYSSTYVAFCWIPMYVLYRRRIFIKI
jgi:predicted acyltransferase